jgi:hypothetical protein
MDAKEAVTDAHQPSNRIRKILPPGETYTPNGHGPEQGTQETKSPLSPLQNICPPQTGQLLRTRVKQGQALAIHATA